VIDARDPGVGNGLSIPKDRFDSDSRVRFWTKVDRRGPDECWEWRACRKKSGYGQFRLGGKMRRAHRIAWMLAYGPVPDGFHVLHSCDNPPCVNYRHLFIGTQRDNVRDRNSKGRQARGPAQGRARLTEGQVMDIRGRYSRGECQAEIARRYDMSPGGIWHILHRKTWTHI
jgi:hypothetical protein